MPFTRVWDATCPREYDRWEADGATWVIQDLLPEDDEEALRLLVENLVPDESLCIATGVLNDEESMRGMAKFWRVCLEKRMSLACYVEKDNQRTLAGVNCCLVVCKDDNEEIGKIEGEGWQNVYNALQYAESRVNVFEYLGVDKVLYAMGLVVRRDYRGARLGAKVLKAREPLSLAQGVTATSTVFTGPASQKCADRAGFQTLVTITFKELAENAGLKYPKEDKCIKLMIKRFGDIH